MFNLKFDIKHASQQFLGQIIILLWPILFFKMAADGHFGFRPLTEFAHTFTTGTQANIFI